MDGLEWLLLLSSIADTFIGTLDLIVLLRSSQSVCMSADNKFRCFLYNSSLILINENY